MRFKIGVILLLEANLAGCSMVQAGDQVKVTNEMDAAVSEGILEMTNTFVDTVSANEFEAHLIYGATEKNEITSVYTYTRYEAFNKGAQNGAPGYSTPVLIKLKKENGKFQAIEYKQPRDGSEYRSSIEKMFPKEYAQQALNDTGHVSELGEKIRTNAKEWSSEK
ncbi:hypothetical protein J9317_03370 [Metabacillus sp. KIGAM252]|uniref:Lipoprotein n=1 Tax=Metabacillus flavus TaxID=2823519 RepID=A0ABS5LAT1_9BACI|nr:hypothetical protein [Metabacillus flavus]MBS2967815.1 hypothetical protein [Metabacillus flavus]